MAPQLSQRLLAQAPLSEGEAQAMLATAQALRRAAEAGAAQPLLKGKNIALLCTGERCASAEAFATAAALLGARVSRVPSDAALLASDTPQARETVRMLGRLYDAVECDDLPAEALLRLERELGVPVFHGATRPDHPVQQLVVAPDDRNFLLQALLVATLA